MNDFIALRRALARHPTESTPRGMLADWLDDRGKRAFASAVRRGVRGRLKDGDYGDGGDGDDGGGYGDGGGGGYGYGGYGDGSYGDGGDGDGGDGDGGGGDGYDGGGDGLLVPEGFAMTDGLYLIVTPGGYYPYVRIGWVEWSDYDLLVPVRDCRIVRRFGSNAQLATIAAKGPQDDTAILDPAAVEYVSVTEIVRAIPADPAAWARYFGGDTL